MEAIILAGGLGTRLRSEVQDIPKPMANIQGRPFLEHVLDRLISQGISRVVFSIGYKSDIVQDYFSDEYKGCEIVYAIEEELLGTGGAIKNAMQFVQEDHVFVLNGDSTFFGDLSKQFELHQETGADVTFALKPMQNIDRYGTVELGANNRITHFYEKQPVKEGLINVGVYLFKVQSLMEQDLPVKFSIEREFFEKKVNELTFIGYPANGYFLDIGIPEDFRRAQYEVGIFPQIDESWTLFLDRDGVINKKREHDYVKSLDELELLPDAISSISELSTIFGKVIIVTNQQGVGKGLMTHDDVDEIHELISEKVVQEGGNIDAIYFAPQLASENSDMRKPNLGMALQAKEDFPTIDFSKSIMVGDSKSDMEFGERANMVTVMISEDKNQEHDYKISSLSQFKETLSSILFSQ